MYKSGVGSHYCMVAEPLKCPTGAIHFGLLIASCDCNITTSAHMLGQVAAKS